MFDCILGELHVKLLVMLILILLEILIREDILHGMFLLLVVLLSFEELLYLQITVAVSTTETAYKAITEACKKDI